MYLVFALGADIDPASSIYEYTPWSDKGSTPPGSMTTEIWLLWR